MSDRLSPPRENVVGAPRKDAVISLLEPRSPCRPWPTVENVRGGDGVVVVFDCEPRLVVTDVARVDVGGNAERAIANLSHDQAVPVSRVGAGLEDLRQRCTLFEGRAAARLVSALDDHRFVADPLDAFGHSSMAAARVLLESDGRCGGCDAALKLHGENARGAVAVWTVESLEYRPEPESPVSEPDPDGNDLDYWRERLSPPQLPLDWPAALCGKCERAMSDGGFSTFLDYRFSRHPACPTCGGQRTQRAVFGMLPSFVTIAPWQDARGCCVTDETWTCTLCMHRWHTESRR